VPNLIRAHVLRFRRGNNQVLTLRTEHSRNFVGRNRERRRCPVVFHATSFPVARRYPKYPAKRETCSAY